MGARSRGLVRRVAWLWRDSVGDFAISRKGEEGEMPVRELNVSLAWLSARKSLGCNGFSTAKGRAGWLTGRHVSLRVIKVGPRYGGSCTAPVATKAPHHRPSCSFSTPYPFATLFRLLSDISVTFSFAYHGCVCDKKNGKKNEHYGSVMAGLNKRGNTGSLLMSHDTFGARNAVKFEHSEIRCYALFTL